MSLESTYRAYLKAIDAKDWAAVACYAQPTVTHNGRTFTNTEYALMVKETSSPYKGILFVPEKLVCNDAAGQVACRIRFDPHTWDGPAYEHVFYDFVDGKISNVVSMIENSNQ
ncbi:hypothetical protein AURDEDRAFT_165339 [Auricularia subglabra TFB-10046 SS5]|nr:hypothetical protein AURDEDRAFT_165339 [Auricularia subglabra TFB-10046 SS5]